MRRPRSYGSTRDLLLWTFLLSLLAAVSVTGFLLRLFLLGFALWLLGVPLAWHAWRTYAGLLALAVAFESYTK